MSSTPRLLPSQKQALTTLLRDHSCLDEKEKVDRNRIVEFVEKHDDAHLRENRLGHLTGSALVLDRSERVLLTHHRKLNKWLQVGGHGEGEWDPAEIARREALEESSLRHVEFHNLCPLHPEVGLRKPFDLDVHEIPARSDDPAHWHLDFRYVMHTTQSPEEIAKTDESNRLEWFEIKEALTLCCDPSLCRALNALKDHIQLR